MRRTVRNHIHRPHPLATTPIPNFYVSQNLVIAYTQETQEQGALSGGPGGHTEGGFEDERRSVSAYQAAICTHVGTPSGDSLQSKKDKKVS